MKLIDNQLVPVYETDKGNKVVDARELHEFLDSKQDFTNWIKNRIEKYEFVMDEDFSIIISKSTGGRPSTEYILAFDTAKEFAMVENNAKGRKARKYFIEIEKRFKTQQHALPQSYAEALRLAADLSDKTIVLEAKIEADKPLVHFAESLQISKDSILVSDLATLLKQNGVDIGEGRLFKQLRAEGYLIKSGTEYNMPTQRSLDLKIFEVKVGSRNSSDGTIKITRTPKITGKGQSYFINKYVSKNQAM